MRILLVYYSFTDQAHVAATIVGTALSGEGATVTNARIDFADPADRLKRPMSAKELGHWGKMAKVGGTRPIIVNPPIAADARHDLIILFSNTWQFCPAVPVRSFLESENAEVFRDTPVAIAVICRGFWKKNLAVVSGLVERAGGNIIATDKFTHPGAWLTSTIQNATYMLGNGKAKRWFGVIPLPPFGLSARSKARLPAFARIAIEKAKARCSTL